MWGVGPEGALPSGAGSVEVLPNVVEELEAMPSLDVGTAEESPAPGQSEVNQDGAAATGFEGLIPGSGAPGTPYNIWWMNPPVYNVGDSSLRILDQNLLQFQESPAVAPEMEAPLPIPLDAGPPDRAPQFPVNSLTDVPLGNLSTTGFFGPNRSLRIGGTRVRYGAQLSGSTAYNSNVFGSAQNPEGDFIFMLQPAIALEVGQKSSVRIFYAPSILKYARFKQFDSINQNLLFSSRLRFNKLEVGLDAGYLTQSGLFLSSQGQSRQENLQARAFANYQITRKTSFLVSADLVNIQTSPGGNQSGISFGGWLDYRYSRKTSVGIGITVGSYVLPEGTTNYQDFLLRLRYSPSAKLFFTAEGGIQFRQSITAEGASYATTTSLLEAKASWLPTRKTVVALRFFRNIAVDAFAPDSLQVITGAELELTWQLFTKAKIEAALASGMVENTALSGGVGETYNFNAGSISFIYQPNDGTNFRIFTSLQQRYGDPVPESNYLSTTTGVEFGLGF